MESKFTEVYHSAAAGDKETECEKVSLLLDLMIDGEASSEDQQYFNRHVEDCVPCFESHQKQKLLKGLVCGHLKRVIVPESLAHLIKAKIQETV